MLDDRTRVLVRRELQQIEKLLSEYDDLIVSSLSIAPTLIEYTALGAVLQSFYNKVPTIKEGAFLIEVLTHSVNFCYIYF